jgi:homoaconitase/3-isopropylmalate dehydratase large subunit
MTTHPIYDLLMHDVTEPLERSVMNVLIEHAGQKVSRPDLVFKVFGHYVQSKELANNQDDRKIRECIERLQQKSFPILA